MVGKERRQPLRHLEQYQKRDGQPLRQAATPAAPGAVDEKRAFRCLAGRFRKVQLQRLGDQADTAVLIDVGHGCLRQTHILPQ